MTAPAVEALIVSAVAASLVPIIAAPHMTSARVVLLQEVEVLDERDEVRRVSLPIERPLTVCLDGRPLVTLMTLGAAPEWLVLGYLRNQRLLADLTALESVRVDWATGTVQVRSRSPSESQPPDAAPGPPPAACALGSALGGMLHGGADARIPFSSTARLSRSHLYGLLETMRAHDAVHRAAGSVHSCAVFRNGELLVAIEDVSRHNGIDTITGWMAIHGVGGSDTIIFTTGRLTAEMVLKAAFNGIPIMVSRNGVTALGCDAALRLGMTLIGRAANRRFLCYTGASRFDGST